MVHSCRALVISEEYDGPVNDTQGKQQQQQKRVVSSSQFGGSVPHVNSFLHVLPT